VAQGAEKTAGEVILPSNTRQGEVGQRLDARGDHFCVFPSSV